MCSRRCRETFAISTPSGTFRRMESRMERIVMFGEAHRPPCRPMDRAYANGLFCRPAGFGGRRVAENEGEMTRPTLQCGQLKSVVKKIITFSLSPPDEGQVCS